MQCPLRLAVLVAASLFLAGCATLEAQWDRVWTPDAKERAQAKVEELRAEIDALADTVEDELRSEVRQIVVDGLLAP